jgi:hypothetical protein
MRIMRFIIEFAFVAIVLFGLWKFFIWKRTKD